VKPWAWAGVIVLASALAVTAVVLIVWLSSGLFVPELVWLVWGGIAAALVSLAYPPDERSLGRWIGWIAATLAFTIIPVALLGIRIGRRRT
jgi:hypothetical protein